MSELSPQNALPQTESGKQLLGGLTGWLCFHCGFMSSDPEEARAHFGDDADEQALCAFLAAEDAQQRVKYTQDQIIELNRERDENETLRARIRSLEERNEMLECNSTHDIRSRFKGCDTINDVFFKFDSMQGEILVARERIKELEAILDAP